MEMLSMCVGSYRTNCYMLWENEECVLIDPGFEPEQIMEQVLCKGKKVAAILLTHGHFDHVGGVKHIAAETGCPVYIHEGDVSLPSRHSNGEIYHTHTYDDGDVITVAGMTFQVLNTPGHTPGSVCLLCGDVMLAGDTLFAGTCGRTDIPPYGNPMHMKASLARLKALEGDYQVFPGHGHATTLEEERRSNPYMYGL